MRAAFLFLLLANLVVFAWQQGLFGGGPGAGREPWRLEGQIAAEKIRLLTPEQLAALRRPARPSGGDTAAACLQLGDFDEASLARVQARLTAFALGDRLRVRRVSAPGWFVVFLPPLATRTEAERVAQELRGQGIRDLVVMGPNTAMHQDELARRGVGGVRMTERSAAAEATRFEIRNVDPALAQQLAELQKDFPQSQLAPCGN